MERRLAGEVPGLDFSGDLAVRRRADLRVLAACSVAAVLTDLALRSGVAGVGGALLVAAASAAMVSSRRLVNPQARALVLAAPVFGLWLAVRAAPWLLALDVLAVGGLLALGGSLARGGNLFDLSFPGLALRGVAVVGHGVLGGSFLARAVLATAHDAGAGGSGRGRAPWRQTARGVGRGLVIAIPLLTILALLLASADAVFASLLRIDIDPGSAILHVVGLAVGGWAMAGLLRTASADAPSPSPGRPGSLGAAEVVTVLGGMVSLYLAFAGSQLLALSGAGRRILETAGLTYAQHARSGFFQLLAVAGVTLVSLMSLRALMAKGDRRTRRWFIGLSMGAVALTLVIVAVAVRRMDLYEAAFGSTVLRLVVRVSALWIGAVFVLLGVWLSGAGGGRRWLPAGMLATGLALLLALNAVNPEAFVARRNVEHADRTGRFDVAYVASLSADAVAALVALLPRVDAPDRRRLRRAICPSPPTRFAGWAAWNWATDAAGESRRAACPGAARLAAPTAQPSATG